MRKIKAWAIVDEKTGEIKYFDNPFLSIYTAHGKVTAYAKNKAKSFNSEIIQVEIKEVRRKK